jgi:hypothetical protein
MKEIATEGSLFAGTTLIASSPWDFELFLSSAQFNSSAVAASASASLVTAGILPEVNLLLDLFQTVAAEIKQNAEVSA